MDQFIIENLPILLCFIVGVGLLVTEAFMPGFGIAGISGIILELAAITLMYINHGIMPALIMTLIIVMLIAFAISMSLRSVTRGRLSKSNLVLNSCETVSQEDDAGIFLNRTGKATTALRPSGIVDLDGLRINVMTEGEFIDPDTPVRVSRVEGSKIFVRKV